MRRRRLWLWLRASFRLVRYVAARKEAFVLGLIFGLFGALSVALGYALDDDRGRWWFDVLAVVAFAAGVGFNFRKVSRRAPLIRAAVISRPPFVFALVLGLFNVVATAAVEDPVFGAILVGGAVGQAIWLRWLTRFERRTGYLVLRRMGATTSSS
jgi:hypothetical protein